MTIELVKTNELRNLAIICRGFREQTFDAELRIKKYVKRNDISYNQAKEELIEIAEEKRIWRLMQVTQNADSEEVCFDVPLYYTI